MICIHEHCYTHYMLYTHCTVEVAYSNAEKCIAIPCVTNSSELDNDIFIVITLFRSLT